MVGLNLKAAFRQLARQKLFSFINILSLAIGISASYMIYLVVSYEFSYDRFQKDGDRIYRVVSNISYPDMEVKNGGVAAPLGKVVGTEIPGIEWVAPFYIYNYDVQVSIPDPGKASPAGFRSEPGIIFADKNYFRLMDHGWLAGNAENAFSDPFRVVITRDKMEKYFPGLTPDQVMGRSIYYNDSIRTTLSGVVENITAKTDFEFSAFISLSTIEATGLREQFSWENWTNINSSSQVFLKLKAGVKPETINAALVKLSEKFTENEFNDTRNLLQPLWEIHFNADYEGSDNRLAHKPTLYSLIGVAVFLLLLGCINFINLTTAQASQRAREIGIRKTLGSSRTQLGFLILTETAIITTLGTLLSIALAPVLLQAFREFIPDALLQQSLLSVPVLLFLIGLTIIVTLLAGFYPALILNGYKPINTIRDQGVGQTGLSRSILLRKGLTVTQFVIAQFFVIGIVVVGLQTKFALNKEMGFRKEGIFTIATPWSDPNPEKRILLANKLSQLAGIEKVSLAGQPPANYGYNATSVKYVDGEKEIETMIEIKNGDSIYRAIYDLKLLAGSWPRKVNDYQTEYAINESLLKHLGFQKATDAVGKTFDNGTTITGVVSDFQAKSIRESIKPLGFINVGDQTRVIHVLLNTNTADGMLWKQTQTAVAKVWKAVYPEDDFSLTFMDERIAGFYEKEKAISHLLKWAAGLSVLISLLGLWGLVIYTTNLRKKEIGIRKVLGASVLEIARLLSLDLLLLVVLAFCIAAPLVWMAAGKWLEGFAYRTELPWWVFILCGLGMTLFALLMLSIRTLRAALANPVKSIRTE